MVVRPYVAKAQVSAFFFRDGARLGQAAGLHEDRTVRVEMPSCDLHASANDLEPVRPAVDGGRRVVAEAVRFVIFRSGRGKAGTPSIAVSPSGRPQTMSRSLALAFAGLLLPATAFAQAPDRAAKACPEHAGQQQQLDC